MTGRNEPLVKSSGCEAAALLRSIDFGVKTISGRCSLSRFWRRSRWKYDAGVDGWATVMASSAHSVEEPLDAGRRVVGALALVAVRQQQHDAGLLAPLGLAGGDVLVDDGLGAVDEVAELRLPHRERLGTGDRVAVLEAERGVLAEQRVVDVERRLLVADMRQRGPSSALVRSMIVAKRDENVPRRVSWPERRTGRPSSSSEPIARISPVPQSIGPAEIDCGPTLQLRQDLGVDGEALGDVGV